MLGLELREFSQRYKLESQLLLDVIEAMASVRWLRERTEWIEVSGLSGKIIKTMEWTTELTGP